MEPPSVRRLSRPAATLAAAPATVTAVALWGDPSWAAQYAVFVGITAVAVVLAELVRARWPRPRRPRSGSDPGHVSRGR
ncbi:MAG TPA: hypothetical protein VK915_14515 [Gaiellaceae bacterium]|nr:hypothetical protein [Gaiellaceae bacterium]